MIEITETEFPGDGVEMKIGLIADFQRKNADPRFVARVVDILNEKKLDTVLIAGDFVHVNLSELPSVEPLKNLETTYGVYGVLGNHDYRIYSMNKYGSSLEMGDKIIEYLESDGTIKILRNENVRIGNVTVIGLDDYWMGLRNETKAWDGVEDGYKIILSHNQEKITIDKDISDAYLFGHTHCGQVRLPILGSIPKILGFPGEYDYKHYTINDAEVYTTCGLAPAPRFFNPPEITIITIS